MKRVLLLLSVLTVTFGCTPSGYVMKGYVGDSSLVDHNVFLYDAFSQEGIDTSLIMPDGTFTFTGALESGQKPFLANIEVEYSEARTIVVVENGSIDINIDYVDGVYIATTGGTPKNDAINAMTKDLERYEKTLLSNLSELESDLAIDDSQKADVASGYMEIFRDSIGSRCSVEFEGNKDNVVGLFSLLTWANVDENLNVDSLSSTSDSVIMENPYIKQMVDAERAEKIVSVGSQYINLEGIDAYGKEIMLSDFVGKGKLVLIDFWASWCVPCKAEIPYLAAAKQKYGNDVTIVGLNVWDTMDEFKKACMEHKITWSQIVDPTSQTFTQIYGVNGIPQILLIDRDGTILAKNLRGDGIAEAIERAL